MTKQLRIESMYAFVQMDPKDNTEGVIAFMDVPNRTWFPMVGADMKMVEKLKPAAQRVALTTGRSVQLVHFTTREEIEVLEP